jgi:outer membrane immunogenic protein
MKYKGFLLATAGGLAIVPGAQAADLAVKAPIMPPPPVANWTGWYIGAHAGAAWQNLNATNADAYAAFSHIDGSSFIGGGQIGYNWQHGNAVFGVEGDISGLTSGPTWTRANGTKSISTKTNWLSTIRLRTGLALGDTMVYATGGLAIGQVNDSQRVCDGTSDPHCTKSDSSTRLGWTVGGGVEHMWDQHWTVGLEGLFVDLGRKTVANPDPNASASSNARKNTVFSHQLVIGRVKLNYKF